jgi:hypothetical protein
MNNTLYGVRILTWLALVGLLYIFSSGCSHKPVEQKVMKPIRVHGYQDLGYIIIE